MLQQILSLPIEKKIGQLFFIGLHGTELNGENQSLLDEISPGGICLFARNIKSREQIRFFLDQIREISIVEPFLSLDQEGGVVDRLRRIQTPLPSAASIKTAEEAAILGSVTGRTIELLGFNMNFAPVVDVGTPERQKFSNGLYSRFFGSSKNETVEFAESYLRAMQSGGKTLGCVKHFPGLGASRVDSHEELPVVDISRDEFFEEDLFPYRELFKTQSVFTVMIAHAVYPNSGLQQIDANGKLVPSSLSFNFVTKLLRDELGFDGVAVTDDLEMGAILKNYGIGEACKSAIAAGADMPAICADAETIRKGFYALLAAVESGEISEERIDCSLRRIAHLKSRMKPAPVYDPERLESLSAEVSLLNKRLN